MAEKQNNSRDESSKPLQSSVFHDGKNAKRLICKHYQCGCKIWAPCCKDGAFYACRICHDETENHKLDFLNIAKLECVNCGSVQNEITRECKTCKESFGNFSCLKCVLFDDAVSKQLYHCDKCGICRAGGRENFYHCDTCGYCMDNGVKDTHKCIPNVSRNDCPICLDNLHCNNEGMSMLQCGHLVHPHCLKSMADQGLHRCPTCNASIFNMDDHWKRLAEEVEASPMPSSYQNFFVEVLCNDCHKVTKVKYHVTAMKCGACPSFNTRRTREEPFPNEVRRAQSDRSLGRPRNFSLRVEILPSRSNRAIQRERNFKTNSYRSSWPIAPGQEFLDENNSVVNFFKKFTIAIRQRQIDRECSCEIHALRPGQAIYSEHYYYLNPSPTIFLDEFPPLIMTSEQRHALSGNSDVQGVSLNNICSENNDLEPSPAALSPGEFPVENSEQPSSTNSDVYFFDDFYLKITEPQGDRKYTVKIQALVVDRPIYSQHYHYLEHSSVFIPSEFPPLTSDQPIASDLLSDISEDKAHPPPWPPIHSEDQAPH